MANQFNDLSQILLAVKDTFKPQSLTITGAGDGILMDSVGPNLINARLSVGAVTALTTLDVKMQASIDNSTWVDVTDSGGSTVAFTTVTAANPAPQTISFNLPVSTAGASVYLYVRAYATLVGTSAYMAVSLLANFKFSSNTGYLNSPTVYVPASP